MKLLQGYAAKILMAGACIVFSIVLSSCTSHKSYSTPQPKVGGVNFGGVFVLEDWFFSSESMAHNVSTPCEYKKSGVASSNIFADTPDADNFMWTSETNLIQQFLAKGYTEKHIAQLFQQHRDTYLLKEVNGPKSFDENFRRLKELGIELVRLPVTWAITYPDHSYTINPGHGKLPVTVPATEEVMIIADPFDSQAKWASIPITQIEVILKKASAYGIKILLEIHAYPGGSGDGTFNGVWPNAPKFWSTGKGSNNKPIYQKNFQTIFYNLVAWSEELFLRDDQSYANGLAGLSPMNEPAHLMGVPAARCDQSSNWGIDSPLDVLDTLELAIQHFQKSSLPEHNIKLYINVIETMFDGGEPLAAIGQWWNNVTDVKARKEWAVLDVHHYIAWDNNFNNCMDDYVKRNMDGTYTVKNNGFRRVEKSTDWFKNLRRNLRLSKGDLLATSEFSASTNSDTWHSCASGVAKERSERGKEAKNIIITNHQEYRNYFIDAQVAAANAEGITTIFWTWMLPYNDNYKSEWSLFSMCNSIMPPKLCGSSISP